MHPPRSTCLSSATALSLPVLTALMCLASFGTGCTEDEKGGDDGTADGGADGSADGGEDGGADGGTDGADGGADGGDGSDGGDGGGTGSETVDAVQAACTTGEEGVVALMPAYRLASEVTWTLDFDAEAEGLGFVDCAYTRTYTGLQRVDIPHVCVDCELIVEGTAVMTSGFEDCAEPLFGGTVERIETWGVGGTDLYRSSGSQAPMGVLATFEAPASAGDTVSLAWDSEYDLTDGGVMVLSATGTSSWVEDPDTLIPEHFGPRSDVYSCGWECNDPGGLTGVAPMAPGATIPAGRFQDQCGDMVDLYDFYGSYLIIDSSQSDCGPCRNMADQAEAFKARMTAQDIPVRMVTLLGNGLADVYGTPGDATVQSWVNTYELTDPVLYDTGWTYAFFREFMPEHAGSDIGWPAWMIVGPDMNVLYGNVGFSSWDGAQSIIEEDWAARTGG